MTEIKPFYDKKADCLMCDHKFTTKRIRSRFIKVESYDTDFYPHYESEQLNPILYQVKVCPKCGFSFTKDFSAYFPPNTQEQIEEKVSRNWRGDDFSGKRTVKDAITTYTLGAYCGNLKQEKHVTIAGLYMRLAWLHRSLANKDQETRFSRLAFNEYQESYSTSDFLGTQMSELRLLYMIGELARRTGQRKQAIQYFSRVVEHKNREMEKSIVEMARDRWYDVREEMKEDNVDL